MKRMTRTTGRRLAGSFLAIILAGCTSPESDQPRAPQPPQEPAPPTRTTETPAPLEPAPPASEPVAPTDAQQDARAEGKRVEYAPHVLIDWSVPQVEVTGRVVLREGPLELLMCAEGTKEHESILATAADARNIFEAMGLIGLEPGEPAAYDPDTQQATPASGQRLRLDIHELVGEGKRVFAAHEWLAPTDGEGPIDPPHWVFSGSTTNANGKMTAAVEGTIACVVDFNTALISIGESHTASNEALWVEALTSAIPAEGAECSLVIRALNDEPIVLTLTPENYFRWNDTILDALELDALIRERILHNPEQKVVLNEAPGEPNPFARLAAAAIVGSGIKRENLTANLLPREQETPRAPVSPAEPEE